MSTENRTLLAGLWFVAGICTAVLARLFLPPGSGVLWIIAMLSLGIIVIVKNMGSPPADVFGYRDGVGMSGYKGGSAHRDGLFGEDDDEEE